MVLTNFQPQNISIFIRPKNPSQATFSAHRAMYAIEVTETRVFSLVSDVVSDCHLSAWVVSQAKLLSVSVDARGD